MRAVNSFVLCWLVACAGDPGDGPPPLARLVVSWDPLACGDPHRIAGELADDGGDAGAATVSSSAWCALGGFAIDVDRFGSYRARVYAEDDGLGDARELEVAIQRSVVQWAIGDPP